MSEADPAPDRPPGAVHGRTFWWTLYACAAVPTLGGLIVNGWSEEAGLTVILLSPGVHVAFIVVGIAMLFGRRRAYGGGLILGALAGAMVGLGTCLLVLDSV